MSDYQAWRYAGADSGRGGPLPSSMLQPQKRPRREFEDVPSRPASYNPGPRAGAPPSYGRERGYDEPPRGGRAGYNGVDDGVNDLPPYGGDLGPRGPIGGLPPVGRGGHVEDQLMPPPGPGRMAMEPMDIRPARGPGLNGIGGLDDGVDFLPHDASPTLFVDGLPTDCTKREAAHIFRPFIGFKEVRLVPKDAKRAPGEKVILCFVEFMDARCAATALEALQGYKFDATDPNSFELRLSFARQPGPRAAMDRGGMRDDGFRRDFNREYNPGFNRGGPPPHRR